MGMPKEWWNWLIYGNNCKDSGKIKESWNKRKYMQYLYPET
jgi:hypothetical protein